MSISTYQIQNILRVYSRQQRLGGLNTRNETAPVKTPRDDEVSISSEGKKQQIFKQVASQVLEQVMAKASKTGGLAHDNEKRVDKTDERQAQGLETEAQIGAQG